MRHFLTAQTLGKTRNKLIEKEEDKIYTNIWKQDLDNQHQQERENNERVN